MGSIIKLISALAFLVCIVLVSWTSCLAVPGKHTSGVSSIQTYRDIPGITNEEINAIEALKASRRFFSYGTMFSAEAFVSQDGFTYSGFTPKLRALLADLFEVPFIQEIHSRADLIAGFNNYHIDFTGELISSADRRKAYYMTSALGQRPLNVLFYTGKRTIEKTDDLIGLKVGFLAGTIIEHAVRDIYRNLSFTSVNIQTDQEALDKLLSGELDVFVTDSPGAFFFRGYTQISNVNILPLVYVPVAMATANPDLEPIISVVNKYLDAGGIRIINNLHKEGSNDFLAYEFAQLFSYTEKEYINTLLENGQKVPVALEHDHYPFSFFNDADNDFQGIVPDILEEFTKLTGIEFEVVSDRSSA